MKETGIIWIGKIPDFWEVWKIGHTTYVKGRIGWQGLTADEFVDEGPYCITGKDFINGKISVQDLGRQKSAYTTAASEYEVTKADLNSSLLQLEILAKTKIISK